MMYIKYVILFYMGKYSILNVCIIMNRRVILYFIVSIFAVSSVSAYFISRELHENEMVITGEYDIWQYESSAETVLFSEYTETMDTIAPQEIQTETDITSITSDAFLSAGSSNENIETTQFLYLNINTASYDELILLDGIGEVLAGNIIGYRNSNGGFRNIEEILNVNGIGEKTFSAIRNHIYVENPVYPADPTEEQYKYIDEESLYPAENSATQEIIQPTEHETVPPGTKFDLNKVTQQELEMIPGINKEIAENIISLRTSIQYFSHPYELLYADGMTEEFLCKIIDYFYIEKTEN